MEDMMLTWIDFICPYILFVLLLTVGLEVCAIFIAIVAAVVATVYDIITGGKKRGSFEHNRCCGTLRGKK